MKGTRGGVLLIQSLELGLETATNMLLHRLALSLCQAPFASSTSTPNVLDVRSRRCALCAPRNRETVCAACFQHRHLRCSKWASTGDRVGTDTSSKGNFKCNILAKAGNPLGQKSCRTKVPRIFWIFVPNILPNFPNFPELSEEFSCFVPQETETTINSPKYFSGITFAKITLHVFICDSGNFSKSSFGFTFLWNLNNIRVMFAELLSGPKS